MGNFKDLTGQRFGRLIVIKRVENDKLGKAQWLCQCDCGNKKEVSTQSLKSGKVQSCGCLHKEMLINRLTTHGKTKTRIYRIWSRMKASCSNPNVIGYKNYGGRGITVCCEWRNNFMSFYNWAIANGYSDELTIDRIDVNGNYEPSNCKWSTKKEQANNMRTNKLLTYNGETHGIYEWERIVGLPHNLIGTRIRSGWSVEKAITTPKMR